MLTGILVICTFLYAIGAALFFVVGVLVAVSEGKLDEAWGDAVKFSLLWPWYVVSAAVMSFRMN